MTTAEWVSSVLGVLGLVGGAIGFFRSGRAARSSKASADTANRASDRSIAAAEAAADAQQRIASAIEQRTLSAPSTKPAGVRWRIDQIGADSRRLTNVGDEVARDVAVTAVPEEASRLMRVGETPDLRPSEGLTFLVLRTMGGPQVTGVNVAWHDSTGFHEDSARVI